MMVAGRTGREYRVVARITRDKDADLRLSLSTTRGITTNSR